MVRQETSATLNWQSELDSIAMRFHTVGCWVGIIANVAWIPMDYMTVPDLWHFWAILRICISSVSLAGLLLKDKLGLGPEGIIYIPALSLCIISGYMYHVVDFETLQVNTLGYCGLFIGIGMLILWKMKHSLILIGSTVVSNIIFYILFSELTLQEVLTGGGIVTFVVSCISVVLMQNRYRLTKTEIMARLELAESNMVIQEKNQNITDSINYAKRIQAAILPPDRMVKELLPNSFVLYKPKAIVAGDFYWIDTLEGDPNSPSTVLFAVADCTGHGVPGALVSVVCHSAINRSVREYGLTQPAAILDKTRELVIETFAKSDHEVEDGMDIALCALTGNHLEYAGASNPLWLFPKGCNEEEIVELKPYKQPVGLYSNARPFVNHDYELQPGDSVYLFSDGYPDQFGGPKGKKLKYNPFQQLLFANNGKPMAEQLAALDVAFAQWKGALEQVDDICVMGVQV